MEQKVPQITLRDGNVMPQLGFGTWQIATAECGAAVGEAIRIGYRSIDTGYDNEDGVGRAIRDSDVPRAELFIASKLRHGAQSRDVALRSFDATMKRLGLEQIDMFSIHWPAPEQDLYVEAWKTLIELQQQGHIRSIGVANFDPAHIDRITKETGVAPVLNQIELHPLFQQRDMRGYHQRRGIRIGSWSPLGPGTPSSAWWARHGRSTPGNLLEHPAIAGIARKYGKTPAQIIIRWHLDDGLILFPKATRPDRIAENFAVFDFALDAEDMYRIEAIDQPEQGRIGAAPKDWNPRS